MFGGNFAPRGWALCSGQLLAISQYDALFSLLGTTYGGNGIQTFGLPDLRGRRSLHWGQGPGLSNYVQGQMSGTEDVTLLSTQMPQHTHAMTGGGNAQVNFPCSTGVGDSDSPAGRIPALSPAGEEQYREPGAANGTLASANVTENVSLGFAGATLPHNNQSPVLAVTFIIALEGIYPSRN